MHHPRWVILFTNAMVMVFDGGGRQVTELQGPVSAALVDQLEAFADVVPRWTLADWRQAAPAELTAVEWLAMARVAVELERQGTSG